MLTKVIKVQILIRYKQCSIELYVRVCRFVRMYQTFTLFLAFSKIWLMKSTNYCQLTQFLRIFYGTDWPMVMKFNLCHWTRYSIARYAYTIVKPRRSQSRRIGMIDDKCYQAHPGWLFNNLVMKHNVSDWNISLWPTSSGIQNYLNISFSLQQKWCNWMC